MIWYYVSVYTYVMNIRSLQYSSYMCFDYCNFIIFLYLLFLFRMNPIVSLRSVDEPLLYLLGLCSTQWFCLFVLEAVMFYFSQKNSHFQFLFLDPLYWKKQQPLEFFSIIYFSYWLFLLAFNFLFYKRKTKVLWKNKKIGTLLFFLFVGLFLII